MGDTGGASNLHCTVEVRVGTNEHSQHSDQHFVSVSQQAQPQRRPTWHFKLQHLQLLDEGVRVPGFRQLVLEGMPRTRSALTKGSKASVSQ